MKVVTNPSARGPYAASYATRKIASHMYTNKGWSKNERGRVASSWGFSVTPVIRLLRVLEVKKSHLTLY